MDTNLLVRGFGRMGARVTIAPPRWRDGRSVSIDVKRDRKGEFFEIRTDGGVDLRVLDVRKDLRHLVLMSVEDRNKDKFLCGHDERHWFAAAVPETAGGVSTVETAIRNLRPQEAFKSGVIRQGEWFFIPASNFVYVEPATGMFKPLLKKEPLSRGAGSKPHICEEMVRFGGVVVWVCRRHPAGLDEGAYLDIVASNPDASKWNWQRMTRDAEVYVRGAVRHSDHATVHLDGWHRVMMSTERFARAAANVVFLD